MSADGDRVGASALDGKARLTRRIFVLVAAGVLLGSMTSGSATLATERRDQGPGQLALMTGRVSLGLLGRRFGRHLSLDLGQVLKESSAATAKPAAVARPGNLSPVTYALGIMSSASIVRMAPAANASINATTSPPAPPSAP